MGAWLPANWVDPKSLALAAARVITRLVCVLGLGLLAAALSRHLLVKMKRWAQALCGLGMVLMLAPGLASGLVGPAVALPVLLRQWSARSAINRAAVPG